MAAGQKMRAQAPKLEPLWERLQQPCTAEQVSADLCQNFAGADSGAVQQDVQAALRQLTDLAFVVTDA